jgi:hypothetical protein
VQCVHVDCRLEAPRNKGIKGTDQRRGKARVNGPAGRRGGRAAPWPHEMRCKGKSTSNSRCKSMQEGTKPQGQEEEGTVFRVNDAHIWKWNHPRQTHKHNQAHEPRVTEGTKAERGKLTRQ